MSRKTAAVFPSRGIGDALLMLIASHRLLQEGYAVTTYHPALKELSTWLPGHVFAEDEDFATLLSYDLVIVQNDNSSRTKKFYKWADTLSRLSIFYPTYNAKKYPPLSPLDQVFDAKQPMAQNIAKAVARLIGSPLLSTENGLTPPSFLQHRIHKKRVVIHPTSTSPEKDWSAQKYLKLAHYLQKEGFSPVFVMDQKERKVWKEKIVEAKLPEFLTLADLAAFVYESGYLIGNDSMLGHLASALEVPTLIIAGNREQIKLWRPGWLEGEVVTPPRWVPNCKGLRLRQNSWQFFLSLSRVIRSFKTLTRAF